MKNIHPIDHQLVSCAEKELRYGQHAKVIWFTGLSGSGKSTLAVALERKLFELGYHVVVLDGDNIRSGINSNLGFSDEDRHENIRRIAEIAKLFLSNGHICIVSFITPAESMRKMARDIIGTECFIDVFIDTPLEVCESRDVKGLYKKARNGEITDFTGINANYEIPLDPKMHLKTKDKIVDECLQELVKVILPRIRY